MTALAFSLFSIGGLCLSVFIFPWLNILPTHNGLRKKIARRCIQRTFKIFVNFMCVSGIMSLTVKGIDSLKNAKGVLVLANHPTLIDVVVIISYMPFANCVVKSKLWDNFFLGGVVRAAGYIRNDDSSEMLINDCKNSLHKDEPLVIFPEGTRSVKGQELRFLRGAAHIALASQVPIVPVILHCDPPTLSKAERWYHIPSHRFHFSLEVKSVVTISTLVRDTTTSLASRRLTEALTHYFNYALAEEKVQNEYT
ncbi:MAG: lysophospholipid acyltransferase family protein [Pseudomonadota bacterium]